MKRRVLLCVLAVCVICGCQVKEIGEFEQESTPNPEAKVFTATIEDNTTAGTKTVLDNEGNVLWKQGDQVSVFAGSTINEQYQVTDESDGETSASLYQVAGPGFVAGTDIANNVAFYPYASTTTIAKSGSAYIIKKVNLSATQNYAEASFGNGAFPMAAVTTSTTDMNLKFKNVLGGLKLQLKGTATIASISITGNNNEMLYGAAELTVSNATTPSITLTDATAKTVTLDCGEGVQLNTETAIPFIIALPPMTMTGGFTITVTDTENKQMEIKTTKSQIITRSNLLKMPAVNYEGTAYIPEGAVDLGLPSGLMWASCNLCETGFVSSPEEYGDYYAWGETEPYYSSLDPLTWKNGKTGYNWASYKWCNGSSTTLTRYNTDSSYGTVDNKTEFCDYNYANDAARQTLGSTWRIPSDAEWTELRTECTWTETTQNGVYGRLVKGPNGNSIFLPAAGYNLHSTYTGNYWSSTLSINGPDSAWAISFGSGVGRYDDFIRSYGLSVRPVSGADGRISVESISLDHDSMTLIQCDRATLTAIVTPLYATEPAVIWSSSNNGVATVDNMGVIAAVSAGVSIITATTYDGGYTATCQITVIAQDDAVDLGLSVKWASCNLGASAPEEYGDYYAWGETEPYYISQVPKIWKDGKSSGYSWASYQWCNGSSNTLTKYCTNSSYGTIDNKTVLDPEDDAAHVKLGGTWRMPTDAEWTELRTQCTWTSTTQNGVNGILATGPNGHSIFLPAAGYRPDTGRYNVGSDSCYWSSSLYSSIPYEALDSRSSYGFRYYGYSVRPVTE